MLCLEILYFFGKPPASKCLFHPFHAIDLLLYLPENIRNQRFSDVFREYRKKNSPMKWVNRTRDECPNVELDVLKVNNKGTVTTLFVFVGVLLLTHLN